MSIWRLYEIQCDECGQTIIHGYNSKSKAIAFMKEACPETISVNGKQFCDENCYESYKEHKRIERREDESL